MNPKNLKVLFIVLVVAISASLGAFLGSTNGSTAPDCEEDQMIGWGGSSHSVCVDIADVSANWQTPGT